MVSSACKSLAASAVMGFVLYGLHGRWWSPGEPRSLGSLALILTGIIVAGVVAYFLMARIFRCPEVSAILGMFKPIVRKTGV
jgi:hypothetical protein